MLHALILQTPPPHCLQSGLETWRWTRPWKLPEKGFNMRCRWKQVTAHGELPELPQALPHQALHGRGVLLQRVCHLGDILPVDQVEPQSRTSLGGGVMKAGLSRKARSCVVSPLLKGEIASAVR